MKRKEIYNREFCNTGISQSYNTRNVKIWLKTKKHDKLICILVRSFIGGSIIFYSKEMSFLKFII